MLPDCAYLGSCTKELLCPLCVDVSMYTVQSDLREGVGLSEAEETFIRNWVESEMLKNNPHISWGFISICHAILSSTFLKLFTLCVGINILL